MVGRRDFDADQFLAEPLTAHVATAGPTVRPAWFLWEEGAFWVITGPWAHLPKHVSANPTVAISVDVCDVLTGRVQQIIARGTAELTAFDSGRGRRMLVRYLGNDEDSWDPRFRAYLHDNPSQRGTLWMRMRPDSLTATDLSYRANP